MTTRIKKSLFGLFTASAIATSLFTSAFALDATQPDEDVLDQYLIESGYSQRFIDAIDETIKLRLYEGQYVHQSTGTTYGVFTEEYQVAYTLNDNGTIAIDDENLNEFERLLEDRTIVERIIDSNESKAHLITSLEGFDLDVKTVQAMPIETALRTLTKVTNEKTAESAIGRYYHVKILPNLSLGFSKSGPSISVTAGTSYDQSPDSAASLWSTTSGKP